MSATNGSSTNGAALPPVIVVSELETRVAQYRTALVALVDLARREGGYRSWNDQLLLKEIQRLLDEDSTLTTKK